MERLLFLDEKCNAESHKCNKVWNFCWLRLKLLYSEEYLIFCRGGGGSTARQTFSRAVERQQDKQHIHPHYTGCPWYIILHITKEFKVQTIPLYEPHITRFPALYGQLFFQLEGHLFGSIGYIRLIFIVFRCQNFISPSLIFKSGSGIKRYCIVCTAIDIEEI